MKWKVAPKIDKDIEKEFDKYPPIIRQLLFNRSISTVAAAELFFSDKGEFHDPFLLTGIEDAISAIEDIIKNKQKVFIYGDYDVDGICATSIMWDFLYRKMGVEVLPYIPSRFDEGYGLSETGLNQIMDEGGEVVISVDCGIKDIELVKKYTDKGLKFIITDHHTLPTDEKGEKIYSTDAIAVIHPALPKSQYPFTEICGTAVAWKFITAIAKKLELKFDPLEYVDLVALATVTDIMPLKDENRKILKEGIRRIKNTNNLGMRALIVDSQIDIHDIDTYHFGFILGPKLNAAGRIEHALDGVRMLSTQNYSQALEFAKKLSNLNTQRQGYTTEMLDAADKIINSGDRNNKLHFIYGNEWREGVVGLVAGKLQERYYRPILVASLKNGMATGSARSIPGFNITEAISTFSSLLVRFGGHSAAAGFTLEEKNLEKFKSELTSFANEKIKDEELEQVINIDASINLKDINMDLYEWIERFSPFGFANKKPVFLFEHVLVQEKYTMGKEKQHVKFILPYMIEAIAFSKASEYENISKGDSINIVGSIDLNVWKGRTTFQIKIIDLMLDE